MNTADILQISSTIIVSLGGAGAIILGLSSFFGKYWAEKFITEEKAQYAEDLEAFKKKLVLETESYKLKLKKSELIFAKEFDAATSLVALIRDIAPMTSHPLMDWNDACDSMARDFGKTERLLRGFLRTHGAVLGSEVKAILTECEGLAGENQYDVVDGEVPDTANSAAEALYDKLIKAEAELLKQVSSQVSV